MRTRAAESEPAAILLHMLHFAGSASAHGLPQHAGFHVDGGPRQSVFRSSTVSVSGGAVDASNSSRRPVDPV